MTNYEISQLSPLSSPAGNDVLVIVDVDDTSTPPAGSGGSDKKITVSNLLAGPANVTTATTTYTAGATDSVILCNGGSAFTVTLPTAVGVEGRLYTLINIAAFAVTVATTSAQTINGVSTYSIPPVAGASVIVVSDGSNWQLVGPSAGLSVNFLVDNPSSYAAATFTGVGDGAQFSNFQLADDVYPLDATGHYWAFSHRTSAHVLLLYNYDGASYTSVLAMGENGEIVTVGNSQLDDGSGNMLVTGVAHLNGGTDTSSTATASSPSFTTATARQMSTTQDVMLYIAIQTSAALAVAIGPTSTPANTIMPSKSYALGMATVRVPAGWYVEITGTIADLTITQVTC